MNSFPQWLYRRNPEFLVSNAKIVSEQYGGFGLPPRTPAGTPKLKVPPTEPVLPSFSKPKTPEEDIESSIPSSPDPESIGDFDPPFPASLFYPKYSQVYEEKKRLFYYFKPINAKYINSFSEVGPAEASKALAAFGYIMRTYNQYWYSWIPYFGSNQAEINSKQDRAFRELSAKYKWEYYDGVWYRPKNKEELQELLKQLKSRVTDYEKEIAKSNKEAREAFTNNEKMEQAFKNLAKSAGIPDPNAANWITGLQSGTFSLHQMNMLANNFIEKRNVAVKLDLPDEYENMNKNLSLVLKAMEKQYPQNRFDAMNLRNIISISFNQSIKSNLSKGIK
jgi:predicted protein tyrosine phosphatase